MSYKHLSKAEVIVRPRIMCLALLGKGDPLKHFDDKVAVIQDWLHDTDTVKADSPVLGIFYNDRSVVGIDNVVWEACVPIKDFILDSPYAFKIIPTTKVLTTRLSEGYDKIGDAIKHLESFSKKNDITLEWPLTEIYIQEGPNPITDIQMCIK